MENKYEEKLRRELDWHKQSGVKNHFLNSRIFYTKERQTYCYDYVRKQLQRFVGDMTDSERGERGALSLLIAPVGSGGDIPYFESIFSDITGVDLSKDALDKIKKARVKLIQCDMLHMDCFEDESFDIVVTPLFFHHFNSKHADFVKEIVRVLKPGGHFVAMEPSLLYPIAWLAVPLRRLVGNITGQFEDEAPFLPSKLIKAMKYCGLIHIRLRAASYSHNRFPVKMAALNNVFMKPFVDLPVINQFAWLCLFYGRRPV